MTGIITNHVCVQSLCSVVCEYSAKCSSCSKPLTSYHRQFCWNCWQVGPDLYVTKFNTKSISKATLFFFYHASQSTFQLSHHCCPHTHTPHHILNHFIYTSVSSYTCKRSVFFKCLLKIAVTFAFLCKPKSWLSWPSFTPSS